MGCCNNGFGGGGCLWIIVLILILCCCCGNGRYPSYLVRGISTPNASWKRYLPAW